jgi:hypothetical protein
VLFLFKKGEIPGKSGCILKTFLIILRNHRIHIQTSNSYHSFKDIAMRNHYVNGNQLVVAPPAAHLAKVIQMNLRNWVSPLKEIKMTRNRKEEIGRISTPVNPPVARQHYLPIRMSHLQISRLDGIQPGMVVFNIDDSICQRYDGRHWYTILHYPGERYLGGIVMEINRDGTSGLITTISSQNTTVQWKDNFHRLALEEVNEIPAAVAEKWKIEVLRGNNITYAVRMAGHYCVTANGQMIRGWRIPLLSELLLLIENSFMSNYFTTGAAWAFQEQDRISWLHLLPSHSENEPLPPHQYFVRLVRPF